MTYFFFRFSLTGQRILAIQPSDRALIGGPDRDGLTESAAEPPPEEPLAPKCGRDDRYMVASVGGLCPYRRTGSELSA
jgi:hypothetical protein